MYITTSHTRGAAVSTFRGKSRDPSLEASAKLLAQFRDLDPTMPSQEIAVFLAVCLLDEEGEGVLQIDLQEHLSMTQAATSRNLRNLGDQEYRLGENLRVGRGLVAVRPNPMSRKQNVVKLTPKGRLLRDRIRSIVC